MTVKLDAIKFNHDPNTATTNAINLRKNATELISVPEWTAGASTVPEDSRAAYAKAEVAGNEITIQARFKWAGGEPPASVEIRAIDDTINPAGPSGCVGVIVRLLRALIRALVGNVLGEVEARSVSFGAGGVSAFESFKLVDTRLDKVGVGIRTTVWRWQYRVGKKGSWTDFDTSRHRIYVLLAVPTAPWEQIPYTAANLQLPWTDVLDKACSWAAQAPDEVGAAGKITARVYDLGHSVMTYDCPNYGASHYTFPNFDCTAFLELIDGGVGNGKYVNCTDCATFVSTFANAVGCDLWQSRMGWSFDLNPILAIGSNTWQTACGWSSFNYHEVPWKGTCTASEPIYDACLMVDGDSDPKVAPHTSLLPVNMVFGTAGSGGYRDHLSHGGTCDPLPNSRTRRRVF